MDKQTLKEIFKTPINLILAAAIGIGLNVGKNPNEIKQNTMIQTQQISQNLDESEQMQTYRNAFEKRRLNHSLLQQFPTEKTQSQKFPNLKFQTLEEIKKIIWPIIEKSKKTKLNPNEIEILQRYSKTFNPNSQNLKWWESGTIHLLQIHKKIIRIEQLKIEAQKFINSNSNKINKELLFIHVANKSAIKGGKYIDFSQINENLSANIYKYCMEFGVNIKLVHFLLLIENNFGKLTTSDKGAKGMSQTMPENVKTYFGKDRSNWAHFLTTFKLLKDDAKILNINVSNPQEITEIDFLISAVSYFDGTTNLIQNPKGTFNDKDIGFNYLLKALSALKLVKFQLPTKIGINSDNTTFHIEKSQIK